MATYKQIIEREYADAPAIVEAILRPRLPQHRECATHGRTLHDWSHTLRVWLCSKCRQPEEDW